MDEQILELSAAEPFVRYAEDVPVRNGQTDRMIKTYDHRLFYVVSGSALLETENGKWELGSGSVMYWMAGISYRLRPVEGSGLRMIKLNFDFTQANAHVVSPIPVAEVSEWEPHQRLERVAFSDAIELNGVIVLRDAPQLLPYLHGIVEEMVFPQSFGRLQLSNLMRTVLVLLQRAVRQQVKKVPKIANRILEYISAHYAEELTNHKLAEMFGYHVNYMGCLIAEQTGMPLHRYLLRLRIRHALNLLTTTQMPIAEIAHEVGFQSASYFSQYFKQCMGHAPSKFRIT